MGTIIIVEGKSDTRRLKEVYPNIITFETSGLGLDEDKIDRLKLLSKSNELIVFTDPDGPGEIIRRRLIENIDNLSHAYLPNEKAISKDKTKVGIEHASDVDIKNAFDNVKVVNNDISNYTLSDLIDWNIYNSKLRRNQFCNNLNIAFGNNKKVLNQLNSFNISLELIIAALKEIDESSK